MAVLLKRKKPNISGIGLLVIMPGINHLSDEQVEEAKKNPGWQEMIDCGVHEIIQAKKADAPKNAPVQETASIAEMSISDAKKVIAATVHADSLRIMSDEEDAGKKRHQVFKAIEVQLKKVSADAPDENDGDEGDE